jgi:hypothetical protein
MDSYLDLQYQKAMMGVALQAWTPVDEIVKLVEDLHCLH